MASSAQYPSLKSFLGDRGCLADTGLCFAEENSYFLVKVQASYIRVLPITI
jgi:hypothetical protein